MDNTLKFLLTLEDVNELVPTFFDSVEIKEDKVEFSRHDLMYQTL